ncbi:MAG: hypothetical protein ACR2MP_30355, partial [Streptosporangiaceae bacterium]
MSRLPGSVLAARQHAAIKAMAAMGSRQGPRLSLPRTTTAPASIRRNGRTGRRPQRRGQIRDLRPKDGDLLPESRQLGGVIRPGGGDLAEFGAKTGELGGQVSNGGGAFGQSIGSSGDEHSLAGMAGHQAVAAELGDRGPD